MTNTLANYDMQLAARMALMWLKNSKGVVRNVSRQAEVDRQGSFEQGQTINMRRSTLFGAASSFTPGTGTTAEDVKAQNVSLTLDQHYEKKFTVSDVELAYSTERLIQEHIGPAVDRVAEAVENSIYALGHYVGPHALATQSGAQNIILAARKVLRENQTPFDGNVICAIDPSLEETFLADAIFHAAEKTGQGENQGALRDGSLGQRFGVNFFGSQLAYRNVAQNGGTAAAAAGTGDRVGAIKTTADVNATSVVLKGLTDSQTLKALGDRFTIAGDPTVYRITNDATSASTEATVNIFPALRKPAAADAVVTLVKRETIEDASAGIVENLMFHREAIGLCMAPLSQMGDGMGARIATVVDDETGLSLRLRMWYAGAAGLVNVAVDALWGVALLNPMLACRMLRAQS